MNLSELTDDVLIYILSYLPGEDLLSVGVTGPSLLVCRWFFFSLIVGEACVTHVLIS